MTACTTCKGTGTVTGTVANPMLGPCPDCNPGEAERGFPPHVLDATLATLQREAEQRRAAEQQPRWLAGLIARHGEPVTFQPEPIRLGACRYQTWAWVGLGVQVEQTLGAYSVRAHRKGRYAKLAGLERYPTDAEISGVVALAGLDDAPGELGGPVVVGDCQPDCDCGGHQGAPCDCHADREQLIRQRDEALAEVDHLAGITAEDLAIARQTLAHQGTGYVPPWHGLTSHQQQAAVTEAGHWLKSLRNLIRATDDASDRGTS